MVWLYRTRWFARLTEDNQISTDNVDAINTVLSTNNLPTLDKDLLIDYKAALQENWAELPSAERADLIVIEIDKSPYWLPTAKYKECTNGAMYGTPNV